MGDDRLPETRCLGHRQLEVLEVELGERSHRLLVEMAERAGGVDLDPVGAVLDLTPDLVHELGLRIDQQAELRNVDVVGEPDVIEQPGRNAQPHVRNLHTRPRDEPHLDALSHGDVGALGAVRVAITDCREARLQRGAQGVDRLDGAEGDRLVEDRVVERDNAVAVDARCLAVRVVANQNVRVCVEKAPA